MEIVLAIGVLAVLAWTAVVLFRGGLVGGSLLVLLAGACFGHPFFNLPTGPVPLTADRVLLVVVLGQYVVLRYWRHVAAPQLNRCDYLLAALLLALATSTVTHDFRARNAQPLAYLVFFYCMPAAIYWIARQPTLNERGAYWVFGSLAVFGVYLSLTAVAETQQAWSLVFPKYIASGAFKEFYGRGRGPLLNPVANGMVMALGLSAALMAWPRLSRHGKFALLALVPVFAYGVYCTLTRTAWIGAAVALMIVVGLSIPRSWRVAVISGALLVSAVSVSLTWENLLAFKRDKELSAEDMAESAKLRPILATVAWHMFLDRPLLGCGYGQYPQESPAYLADRTTELQLEKARPYVQHNVILGLLTETGLVGAGLFVALLASWTRAAWRLWRSDGPLWLRQMGLLFLAFMGAYLPNAMMHDVSLIPMVNMLLFFLGGTVVGLRPWLDRPRRAELKLWMPELELAVGVAAR